MYSPAGLPASTKQGMHLRRPLANACGPRVRTAPPAQRSLKLSMMGMGLAVLCAALAAAPAQAQPPSCAIEIELSRRMIQEVDELAQKAGGHPGPAAYAGFFQQYQKLPVSSACPQVACALTHAYNQYVRQVQLTPGGTVTLREAAAQPFFAACPGSAALPLLPPPAVEVQDPKEGSKGGKKEAPPPSGLRWAAIASSTAGLVLTVTGATLAILNNQKISGSTCVVMATAAPCAYDYPESVTGPLTGLGAGLIGLGIAFDIVSLIKDVTASSKKE